LFKRFDIPVNSRVLQKYGAGLLHNCGPNPCADEYLNHLSGLAGVNLAYKYSLGDLPKLRKVFRGKGIVYFFYEEEPEIALVHYKETMEALAPDVIAIPIVSVTDPETDVKNLYDRFYRVSREYARRMWG